MPVGRTTPVFTGGNLALPNGKYSPVNSMWREAPILAALDDRQVAAEYHNEFWDYTTGENGLESVISNAGAVVVLPAAATNHYGVLELQPSDGTIVAEDETYVGSEILTWMIHEGSDLYIEYMVRITEANGDDANVIVGLSSLHNANFLQDAGAGPSANYDGVVMFKVFGGTVWQMETSRAGAQTTLANVGTRTTGLWARVGFRIEGADKVTGYIDGVPVGVITGATLPNAAMGLVMGVKTGVNDLEDILSVDRVDIVQTRA